MKISTCHKTKMIRRESTKSYICAYCWYASGTIDITWKKYKRTRLNDMLFQYTLVAPKPIPKTFNHYPNETI